MSFSTMASAGIERIYATDLENQKTYLSAVCEVVRKRNEIAPILKARGFMVPNGDYLAKQFGGEAYTQEYDLYSFSGHCFWENFVMFPITDIVGGIRGFAGYDPVLAAMAMDGEKRVNMPKYKYSSSSVFKRSRFLYSLPGVFEKAVKDEYMILTDGVFDMLYLDHEGFNAGALLGSSLAEEVIFQLSFIKTLFIAQDNDKAGSDLYEKLKSRHPRVKYLRHNVGKDADDILKSEHREEYVTRVWDAIQHNRNLILRYKPKRVRLKSDTIV